MTHKIFFGFVAVAGLALATQAHAGVTGVITTSTATATLTTTQGFSFTSQWDGTDIGIASGYQALGAGSTFSATSNLTPNDIAFRNGNVSSGHFAVTTSHTVIAISFTNDGAEDVEPKLISTILPAGLGLFVGGGGCLDGLTACAPGAAVGGGFQSFLPSGQGGYGNLVAGASFDFKVTGGGDTLYDLSGGLSLQHNSNTGTNMLVTDLNDAAAALAGFRITSPAGSDQQYGVQWDATPFTVDFGLGKILKPGESSTLVYETTVTTFSQTDCLTDACLIAYSAFGDPIGRGGGTNPTVTAFLKAFQNQNDLGIIRQFTPTEDDLLGIDSFGFDKPVFGDDGTLTFKLEGGVPEPASWALMIGGFAAAGATLRRRRRVAYMVAG